MAILVKDLLPIGSVVMLKGAEKRLMVFGVRQQQEGDDAREFDYVAVVYPEGNVGKDVQFLFNHDEIDKVCFRGYEDEERAQFIAKLTDYYASTARP